MVYRDLLEHLVLFEVVEILGLGDRAPRELVPPAPEADDLLRLVVGERLQQDPLDHGENSGVGADPERQSQDGDNREPRASDKASEGELQVLHGNLDDPGARDVAS